MQTDKFTYAAYLEKLSQGVVAGARCQHCSALYLPPRPLCTACHKTEMAWEELKGVGQLKTFTTIYFGTTAMIAAGYDRKHPYATGIVQLEDGPAISAEILGLEPGEPDPIGARMQAEFVTRGEGEGAKTLLAFRVVR